VTLNDRELPTQLGIHNDDDPRSEGTDKRRSRRGRTDDGSYQPRWAGGQPQAGAGDMGILAKNMLLKRLEKNGVKLMPGTKVQRLTKDTISAEQGEAEITLPIETVVVVVGVRPNRKLPEALADSGLEIHTIGDAISPRKALEAIWEGFEAGNQI
jgi:hypothetical protein